MSSSVRCVACTAVVRSDSTPCSCSSRVGVQPYASRHCSFSAGCSERCTCSGASVDALGDGGEVVGGDGAHRVDGRADARRAVAGELGDPLDPGVDVAVAEAELGPLQRRGRWLPVR